MNSMRAKLSAAAMSLLIATVMMVSASFAWFTVSTTAEVSNIRLTMEATDNLEIAWATSENRTSGPAEVGEGLTGQQQYLGKTVSYANDPIKLQLPADVSESGTVSTLTFGEDGRGDRITSDGMEKDEQTGYTVYTYTAPGSSEKKNCAVSYDLWLRTNTAGHVSVAIEPELNAGCSMSAVVTPLNGSANRVADLKSEGITLTANTPTLVQVCFYITGTRESGQAATIENGASIFAGETAGIRFSKDGASATGG